MRRYSEDEDEAEEEEGGMNLVTRAFDFYLELRDILFLYKLLKTITTTTASERARSISVCAREGESGSVSEVR